MVYLVMPVVAILQRVGSCARFAAQSGPDNTLTSRIGKKFDPHDPPSLCTMARQARLARHKHA
ncbi:hypothetical protein [Paraburkholderia caffeinilytica]|uniref:hypothetical protein n=1 Tax=Paraburkholderia caffeinilytica TaxID=1761016 RepID=UPI0013BE96D3|nr:hypothetical protein [Paraburkholderia caffeinilytica]